MVPSTRIAAPATSTRDAPIYPRFRSGGPRDRNGSRSLRPDACPLPQPDQSGVAVGQRPCREKRNFKGAPSMKAIQYRAYGGYVENKFVDLPAPAANDGQVLVRIHTVGINPLDNTFRSGHHYAATTENLPRVGGPMGAGGGGEAKSSSFKV